MAESLRRFQVLYVSAPLPAGSRGADWEQRLREIARAHTAGVILPAPVRRVIRLLYPDGEPLAGARLTVSLFVSRKNHCGVARGLELGSFVTDARGEVSLLATSAPLSFNLPHYEEQQGGPAGIAFALDSSVVTTADDEVTVRRWWQLPEHEYVVRVRDRSGRPVSRVHLGACLWSVPCDGGCGSLPRPGRPVQVQHGILRFRDIDLRAVGSITVEDDAGHKRDLSAAEMRELLTTHSVALVLE